MVLKLHLSGSAGELVNADCSAPGTSGGRGFVLSAHFQVMLLLLELHREDHFPRDLVMTEGE